MPWIARRFGSSGLVRSVSHLIVGESVTEWISETGQEHPQAHQQKHDCCACPWSQLLPSKEECTLWSAAEIQGKSLPSPHFSCNRMHLIYVADNSSFFFRGQIKPPPHFLSWYFLAKYEIKSISLMWFILSCTHLKPYTRPLLL